jgi:hypothetical protein
MPTVSHAVDLSVSFDNEFSTIEHFETEGEDWRGAFYERFTDGILELKQERAAQVKRRLYLGNDVYVVKDLSDAEIEAVARHDATLTCERAINEQREAATRARMNRGQAL